MENVLLVLQSATGQHSYNAKELNLKLLEKYSAI